MKKYRAYIRHGTSNLFKQKKNKEKNKKTETKKNLDLETLKCRNVNYFWAYNIGNNTEM